MFFLSQLIRLYVSGRLRRTTGRLELVLDDSGEVICIRVRECVGSGISELESEDDVFIVAFSN